MRIFQIYSVLFITVITQNFAEKCAPCLQPCVLVVPLMVVCIFFGIFIFRIIKVEVNGPQQNFHKFLPKM